MEELRLPWSNKEGLLYGGIIAVITCIIMCEFNLFKNAGRIGLDLFLEGLICIPILWIVVMLLMSFIVGRVADCFVRKYTQPGDSFYTKIVFNIIACVLMMSVSMTFIGPTIGHMMSGELTLEALYSWPVNWPTNFCVAFWVEMLIAQPAARYTMKHKHIKMLKTKNAEKEAM